MEAQCAANWAVWIFETKVLQWPHGLAASTPLG
jgi:hypothetical protein